MKEIPFIPFYKTIRNIPQAVKNPIPIFEKAIANNGDIVGINVVGGEQIVVTNNADYIKHVLQKNNKNYTKSDVQLKGLKQYVGSGLLTTDGAYWLRQRRLIQPGFHRKRLSALVGLMNEEIEDFLNGEFKTETDKEKPFDMSWAMTRLTFKIVAKSLFSTSLSDEELEEVGEIVAEVQKYFVRKVRQPYLVWWFKLIGKEKYYDDLATGSDVILFKVIDERLKTDEKFDDLLDMLKEVRYEDTGEGMTKQQLRDESLILFVAGHETSANGLTWMWYLLSKHPEVLQKVRAEAERVLGDKKDINFEDLMQLTYCRQVVQETLRLYPPAWAVDRLALGDDDLNGYQVKKGQIFLLFIYGVHRNPAYWENPNVFNPDRFHPDHFTSVQKKAYFPFGGGPRLCIGNNFALMEMQLILAQMARRFDFKLQANQDIDLQPLVTLRARNGILFESSERKVVELGEVK